MTNINNDNLVLKSINEILNYQFFIPHYQRGYRWTSLQVEQLLNDIASFDPREIPGKAYEKTFYCLQPVVVKKMTEEMLAIHKLEGEWHELIDGQQRLTTIFLILQYINQMWKGQDKIPQFTISYETRTDSDKYLLELRVNADDTVDADRSNIDYYHFSKALETIRQWQLNYQVTNERALITSNFETKFLESSKIIWYNVAPSVKSNALFERLNLGKIPLTNAELTKALFLSSNSFVNLSDEERRIKQFEIANLWDNIEHKLNDPDKKFWSFITNKDFDSYDNKIELILDMISGKLQGEEDPLFTFLIFTDKQKQENLLSVWSEIEHFYETLNEWFTHPILYHKIGYLIAAKSFGKFKGVELGPLVAKSKDVSKKDFENHIDGLIKEAVKVEISELRYEDHSRQIFNVLLLFNVLTTMQSKNIEEFYSFKHHKGLRWSLEHIHARQTDSSEGFRTTRDLWKKWLNLHAEILEEIFEKKLQPFDPDQVNAVLVEIKRYNNDQLTWERFRIIFKEVNNIFTLEPDTMDKESEGLPNLALLSMPDNTSLNNAVFEIKRREIIKMDKEGSFIPICTRRAFMKYYSEQDNPNQMFYWSKNDRNDYFDAIKTTLIDYLPENHIEEDEDE